MEITEYPFYYAETYSVRGEEFVRLYGKEGQKSFPLPFKPYYYTYDRKSTELVEAGNHKPVRKVEFDTISEMKEGASTMKSLESDLNYVRRMMIDLDLKISNPRKAYVDIETWDKSGGSPDSSKLENKIVCIGIIYDDGTEEYLDGEEKDILEKFVKSMENVGMIVTYNGGSSGSREREGDKISYGGVWSNIAFDIPYIAARYELLELGSRHGFDEKLRHCDFVDLLQVHRVETKRIGEAMAGGYGLDNVCQQVLGIGKIPRTKKIAEMGKEELREYNMRDIEILKQLDEKMQYTAVRVSLAQITNCCLVSWVKNHKKDEILPLNMIDNMCVKECNKNGMVCKSKGYAEKSEKVEGAYVKEPKMGIYEHITNYDVNHLYPSIMIRDKISFDKDGVVIPNILQRLLDERKKFKAKYNQTKSQEDYIVQYAYKVLANSIYGAFSSAYFRYFDQDKAAEVTSGGRKALKGIVDFVEGMGYKVIYGDTDSTFIDVEKDKIQIMEKMINEKFNPLKVEVGEHYEKIIFVGTDKQGTKKRYTGLYVEDGKEKIKNKGFEYIRRDFTVFGREFMLDVVHRIFHGAKFKEIMDEFNGLIPKLKTGKYNSKLINVKGVKALSEYKYKKGHAGTPHVRALRKLVEKGYAQPMDIHYVYVNGDVEPVIDDKIPDNLDYPKYIKPIENVLMQILEPLAKSEGLVLQKGRKRKSKEIASNSTLDSFGVSS